MMICFSLKNEREVSHHLFFSQQNNKNILETPTKKSRKMEREKKKLPAQRWLGWSNGVCGREKAALGGLVEGAVVADYDSSSGLVHDELYARGRAAVKNPNFFWRVRSYQLLILPLLFLFCFCGLC